MHLIGEEKVRVGSEGDQVPQLLLTQLEGENPKVEIEEGAELVATRVPQVRAFKGDAAQPWRLFIMTGILGGYTTFSAFSLDAALLYERGEIGLAATYVIGSVVLAIAGLFAGLALVRSLA